MSPNKASSSTCILVLGDQLFPDANRKLWGEHRHIFMAESWDLCTHFHYHKQKIILFLAAMRHYRDSLLADGYQVSYRQLDQDTQRTPFLVLLRQHLLDHKVKTLIHFAVSDRFFEQGLIALCQELKLERVEHPSPSFLTSRQDLEQYFAKHKQAKMQSFYQEQRLRLGVMVEKGKPWGGKWSFDTENRKKLPAKVQPPSLPKPPQSKHVDALKPWVEQIFAEHPGQVSGFLWPVTREAALVWLKSFLKDRFELFGPYEDAMTQRSDFVFHSALSPLMNLGLLTPFEVVGYALKAADAASLEIASLEGFVRQIIGWREFIFGVDHVYGPEQAKRNFFNHKRGLTSAWYTGDTGIVPLDHCIRKALRLGYVHHIERLMILSNIMLLCEIDPQEVYRWFMELCVDSADWVMGPNVFGMGQFSDGGIFATKPYIGGSNYVLKMSDYTKGPWCDVMDGLYWRFIARHRTYFASQPRLSMMSHLLDKIPGERLATITAAAEDFLQRHTRT